MYIIYAIFDCLPFAAFSILDPIKQESCSVQIAMIIVRGDKQKKTNIREHTFPILRTIDTNHIQPVTPKLTYSSHLYVYRSGATRLDDELSIVFYIEKYNNINDNDKQSKHMRSHE